MSAILFWLLLLFGADLGPAASATPPADTTTPPVLTVSDGGGGIPPYSLP